MAEKLGHWRKLQEISDVSYQVLNDWECDFIETMLDRGEYYLPTERQMEVIDRIYLKVCESPY